MALTGKYYREHFPCGKLKLRGEFAQKYGIPIRFRKLFNKIFYAVVLLLTGCSNVRRTFQFSSSLLSEEFPAEIRNEDLAAGRRAMLTSELCHTQNDLCHTPVSYATPQVSYAIPQVSYGTPQVSYATPQVSYPLVCNSPSELTIAHPQYLLVYLVCSLQWPR
jgi:hypothetical protein